MRKYIKSTDHVTVEKYNQLKSDFDSYIFETIKEKNRVRTMNNVQRVTESFSPKIERIVQKKKFKPSDLSYKELEECTNYFVENQHLLKNKIT
jgi:hypothetical protein